MKIPRISESAEQAAIIQWAEIMRGRVPDLSMLYHVPNGGKRSKSEAGRFKEMGVRAGVPDLVLPVARGKYHGLYIELKARGGKASDDQIAWLSQLRAQDYAAVICVGAEIAISVISRYLHGDEI